MKRIKSDLKNVMNPNGCTIICDSSLEADLKGLKANIISLNFRNMCKSKKDVNFILLGKLIAMLGTEIVPEDFSSVLSKNSDAILEAIRLGYAQ